MTDFLGLLSWWFWISQRSSTWQVFLYFCSLWICSRPGPVANAQQIPSSQMLPRWNFCLSWLQVFIVPSAYFGRISGWYLFTYTRTYPIRDSLAKLDDRMHPLKPHELNLLFFRDMHNYAAGIDISQQLIQQATHHLHPPKHGPNQPSARERASRWHPRQWHYLKFIGCVWIRTKKRTIWSVWQFPYELHCKSPLSCISLDGVRRAHRSPVAGPAAWYTRAQDRVSPTSFELTHLRWATPLKK